MVSFEEAVSLWKRFSRRRAVGERKESGMRRREGTRGTAPLGLAAAAVVVVLIDAARKKRAAVFGSLRAGIIGQNMVIDAPAWV
jgi:hypothetical protein